MVRKHNVLTAIAATLAIGAGTLIGVSEYRYREKTKQYNGLVAQEAVRFKACPDKLKLKDPPGNCASYEERAKTRNEADRLATKGEYLNAGLLYVELGDWVSARNMAGRTGKGDRKKIKYAIQLRQDALNEAIRQLKKKEGN